MLLKQQIYTDLVTAMKAKEELKLSTLRMLKAEIMKFEVSGVKKEANDEEVLKIIKKAVKQRQDSANQFEAAGRADDANKEKAEQVILEFYLPAQMPVEEIEKMVDAVIAETGFSAKADFGKVMGMVMQKTEGNADGGAVKEILQLKLK